ncbi:MAG: GntR family transcriptional regulator, partial [Clostridia bacterium]|nr:GntR family transcriptional regulator [Clostridia bacterium]
MADKHPPSLLRPMNNRSVVDQIIERLTGTILSGELRPGDRIPTEAELVESMGVGRNSVREAIKALVAMGVLNIRRSEGTFVANGFSDRMLEPMVYGLMLEGGDTPAVYELRDLVETGVLRMAIEKADARGIEGLRAALDNIAETIRNSPDCESLMDADIAFHHKLLDIVGNPMITKISQVIERISRQTREYTVQM